MAKKELIVEPGIMTLEERRAESIQELKDMDPEYEQFLERMDTKKKARIHRSVGQMRTGLHMVAPITCLGPSKCPFIEHCPIPERNEDGSIEIGPITDYPMYRSCVFELLYMRQKVLDYLKHLEVDPDNPIEMALINDLAVIDLYKNRAMMVMSGGDKDGDGRDFMKTDLMQNQGEHGMMTSTQTQLHPAAVYIDVLEKRRDRLLGSLMETRKSKSELAIKLGHGRVDSDLREELTLVRKALEAAAGVQPQNARVVVELPLLIDDDED